MKIKITYEQENDEAVYSIERSADSFTIYPKGSGHVTIVSSKGTIDNIIKENGIDRRLISIKVES